MPRLLIILVMIAGGGYLLGLLGSDSDDTSSQSQATGFNALFQEQINAVGKRRQRKKFAGFAKIPLDGNEVALADLLARPEKYLQTPFVIFGTILPNRPPQNRTKKNDDRFAFRFQEWTAKRQPVPQAIADVWLTDQRGSEFIKQKKSRKQFLTYGRFRVSLLPDQKKATLPQLEILDWQWTRNDHSGFEPWNVQQKIFP